MDTTHLFELNAALQGWRAGLSGLAPDDVAELEGHLLDSMAELRSSGLTGAEAFELAVRRLGSADDLAAAMGAAGGEGHSRSRRLSTAGEGTGWRRWVSALLLWVGLIALLLAGWAAWGALQPRPYFGRVVMELLPSGRLAVPGLAGEAGGAMGPSVSVEEQAAAEMAVIRSAPVLERVVRRVDLANRWGLASAEEAITRLRSMLTVSSERGTNLVALELRSTDPKEAPRLANAVAEAYSAFRSEEWAKSREEREQRMAAVLQEKEAAKDRARLEWLGTVQRSGSVVGGEAGGRGNESGAGEPGDGGASGSPPASTAASQPERWAVDRARVAYERERAEYEDTKRLMSQVAAWTNPVVIHEHAIEQVPFGAATMRYHLIAIGVLTVVGLAALATGWRIKSR